MNAWMPEGVSTQSLVLDAFPEFITPTELGVYYIIFASAAQQAGCQVASVTAWTLCHCADCVESWWNDGNDLADLTEQTMPFARTAGWGWLSELGDGDEYRCTKYGVTYVKVVVEP
jgi:hypothetical protein